MVSIKTGVLATAACATALPSVACIAMFSWHSGISVAWVSAAILLTAVAAWRARRETTLRRTHAGITRVNEGLPRRWYHPRVDKLAFLALSQHPVSRKLYGLIAPEWDLVVAAAQLLNAAPHPKTNPLDYVTALGLYEELSLVPWAVGAILDPITEATRTMSSEGSQGRRAIVVKGLHHVVRLSREFGHDEFEWRSIQELIERALPSSTGLTAYDQAAQCLRLLLQSKPEQAAGQQGDRAQVRNNNPRSTPISTATTRPGSPLLPQRR
jgi:hypothetical protein